VPDVVFHYSEDPAISRFVPHVPATNPAQPPSVWAIDARHAPLYWFPRDCPRVTVWANDETQHALLRERFVTAARRVQAAPLEWLDRIRGCVLYEYELDATSFVSWSEAEGQWVAHESVVPLAVRAVGDLLARHVDAGVELRLVPDLAPLRAAVITSGFPFSIVRYRNTQSQRARKS
jgi:hypothetical protein